MTTNPYFLNPRDVERLGNALRKKREALTSLSNEELCFCFVLSAGPRFQSELKPNNAQTKNETHA